MIELSTRKELIRHHPYFSSLNEAGIDELAKCCIEKHCGPNEIIIAEGDIVDAVYIIAKGEAEIDVRVNLNENIPQCLLRAGDAIGLSHEGFFSQTGLRTATLISLSNINMIGWPIDVFNDFLKRHHEFITTRKIASDKMLRMYFIKQAEPFSDLPPKRVEHLAEEIEEIELQKGTVLFKQGDEADHCYLICSGEIEMYKTQIDGSEKIVAIHKPWRLIGESVLYTTAKRYASAKISEAAKLLILKKETLYELMKYKNTAESIMSLIIERCSPSQAPGIEHFHRLGDEDQPIIILKNKSLGRYYQLSEEGWFVWQHLDGHNNLQDITTLLYNDRKIFAPLAIADTILKLSDEGFVNFPDIHIPHNPFSEEKLTRVQRFLNTLHQWRYLQSVFYNIDDFFTSTYKGGIYLLYSKFAQILLALISLIGVFCFAYHTHHFNPTQVQITHYLFFLLALFLINLLLTLPHEMAHGYTTKYYNHEVHRAGIIFNWLGLAAYVDTSDMWLSTPRSRIFVSLAGPYTDFIIAGFFSILACTTSPTILSLMAWLLALLLYYSVFKNLNPLQETDGYYIAKDFCGDPHLRFHAFQWLKSQPLGRLLSHYDDYRCESLYLLVCGLFQILTLGIAIVIAYYLRLHLPTTLWGIPTYHISWILPTLVILHFILIIRQKGST